MKFGRHSAVIVGVRFAVLAIAVGTRLRPPPARRRRQRAGARRRR